MDRQFSGDAFGRYRLDNLLGEGGMAQVYRATDPAIGRAVAVKVVHPHLARDPAFVARFLREAQVIARLQHPHIVPLYDFGEQAGTPYIVMPYLAGGTFVDRLREGLTANEALALLGPIAAALDYAHARGVVHRDVKPSNIFFTAEGEPLLGDFGIARVLGDATFTATGTHMGTALYLSPEQAQGQPFDGRADLYALGVILYEALVGKPPFPMSETDTPFSVALRVIATPPPTPTTVNPALPTGIDAVLLRALAKSPDDRYPSGGALLAALSAALATPGTATAFAAPTQQGVAQVIIPAPTRVSARSRRGTQRPRVIVGITLVVLLLCGFGGIGVRALTTLNTTGSPAPTTTNVPPPVIAAGIPPTASAPVSVPSLMPNPTVSLPATATLAPTTTPIPAAATTPPPSVKPLATVAEPSPTVPPPTPLPTLPPPTATRVPPTSTPTAVPAGTPLEETAHRAILSLPGTSSGVFARLGEPYDYAADDPDMVLPAGSLIKLPLAGAVYEQVATGRWRFADTFTLTATNRTEGTGVIKDQPLGTIYTLDRLVEIMLLYSDNTAANMLIDRFGGFGPINDFSARQGLKQTTLRRKLFDQAAQARGVENTTTTGDMAVLLLKIGAGQVVNEAVSERLLGHLVKRAQIDREWMLRDLPAGVLAAHLTGTLTGYRADAGIIEANGSLYILVLYARDPDEGGIERAIARVSAEIYRAVTRR